MWVIILDIIVVWLIENAVRIVIAIWILVSNATSLTQRWIRVETAETSSRGASSRCSRCAVTIWTLTCDQQDSFVEATNYRDLWLLLLRLLLWLRLLLLWRVLRALLLRLVSVLTLPWRTRLRSTGTGRLTLGGRAWRCLGARWASACYVRGCGLWALSCYALATLLISTL